MAYKRLIVVREVAEKVPADSEMLNLAERDRSVRPLTGPESGGRIEAHIIIPFSDISVILTRSRKNFGQGDKIHLGLSLDRLEVDNIRVEA